MPFMIENNPSYLLKGRGQNEVVVIPKRNWGLSTPGIETVLDLLEKEYAGTDLHTLPSHDLALGVLNGLQVVRNYTAATELLGNNTDPEIRSVIRVVARGVSQLINTLVATDAYPRYANAINNAMLPLKITNP